MTSKQLRITSDLINSPLYKMSVGFDRLFDEMFTNPVNITTGGYPPYNVAKVTDKESEEVSYEITLAVAGFTQDDIDITVEDKHLGSMPREHIPLAIRLDVCYSKSDFHNYLQNHHHQNLSTE